MNKDTLRQIVTIVGTVVVLTINTLANTLPLNGRTTGDISDRFDVYFVPAGYVFSIWGLIYLGLTLFTIYQALPAQRANPHLRRIGYWYALSCVANSLWIVLWHYEYFALTVLVIVTLLIALIIIYLRLGIGRTTFSATDRWLIAAPFSVYLGWLTVATIANVTTTLEYYGWSGWSLAPQTWAILLLAVASLIALLIGFTRGDWAYLLVLVWAFIGIAVKQADTQPVVIASLVAAAIVVAAIVLGTRYHARQLVQATV